MFEFIITPLKPKGYRIYSLIVVANLCYARVPEFYKPIDRIMKAK